jgi:FtsP/CotA-like multicopper oxidase with cupredoxin domain
MDRKSFLQWLGLGGSFLGGSYLINKKNPLTDVESCSNLQSDPIIQAALLSEGRPGYNLSANPYGGMIHSPLYVKEDYGRRFYFPPNYKSSESKEHSLTLTGYILNLSIAHNITTEAWTYNGVVPAPILRFNYKDKIKIKYINKTNDLHSIHFHGNHDPIMDGWEGIPSLGEFEYILECDPPGVHPYHCHIPPIAKHITKGLYGVMIVDPIVPRKPAHEYVLIFSGWDLQDKSKNDIFTWNGLAGFYERYPIKVPVGERVRLYVVNMAEYDSLMTFHLHGKTFDIYKSGHTTTPDGHSDVVSLGATERVILEFTLEKKGRYMFHPHQSKMAERGAMGWIVGV